MWTENFYVTSTVFTACVLCLLFTSVCFSCAISIWEYTTFIEEDLNVKMYCAIMLIIDCVFWLTIGVRVHNSYLQRSLFYFDSLLIQHKYNYLFLLCCRTGHIGLCPWLPVAWGENNTHNLHDYWFCLNIVWFSMLFQSDWFGLIGLKGCCWPL